MKHFTLDNITTGILVIGIILAIILLTRVIKKYNKEKEGKKEGSEYYRRLGTLAELATIQAASGNLATNLSGDETALRNQGVFSRDEADRYVRKGVMGSSAFETSGDSMMLDPSTFTAYGGKSFGSL